MGPGVRPRAAAAGVRPAGRVDAHGREHRRAGGRAARTCGPGRRSAGDGGGVPVDAQRAPGAGDGRYVPPTPTLTGAGRESHAREKTACFPCRGLGCPAAWTRERTHARARGRLEGQTDGRARSRMDAGGAAPLRSSRSPRGRRSAGRAIRIGRSSPPIRRPAPHGAGRATRPVARVGAFPESRRGGVLDPRAAVRIHLGLPSRAGQPLLHACAAGKPRPRRTGSLRAVQCT